uniref:Uncharacterized protein n=1 Tax=Branchiostoma floridae TaxID=7739 RepID=C3YAH9_BRAFL|eukprot:XP_002606717.1 hypothetical protein BRAFLDRAFT_82357 [Branchiostoma floridae]
MVMADSSFMMARLKTTSGAFMKAAASGRRIETAIACVTSTASVAFPMLTSTTPVTQMSMPQHGMRPILSFRNVNPIHAVNNGIEPWMMPKAMLGAVYGTSLVYDQQGGMWTFTHAPRTMLFHYNTDSLQVYSKADIHQPSSDYVTLSPIGPWTLAVPREYNPGVDVTGVREIRLQLTLTFLPCAQPVCPPRTRVNFTDAGGSSTAEFRVQDTAEDVGPGSAAWVVAVLVVLAMLLVAGIVYVRKRRSAQAPPGLGQKRNSNDMTVCRSARDDAPPAVCIRRVFPVRVHVNRFSALTRGTVHLHSVSSGDSGSIPSVTIGSCEAKNLV